MSLVTLKIRSRSWSCICFGWEIRQIIFNYALLSGGLAYLGFKPSANLPTKLSTIWTKCGLPEELGNELMTSDLMNLLLLNGPSSSCDPPSSFIFWNLFWNKKHSCYLKITRKNHWSLHGASWANFLNVFCLFVWFDSLRPINNLSVKQGRVFLGWTSTKLG